MRALHVALIASVLFLPLAATAQDAEPLYGYSDGDANEADIEDLRVDFEDSPYFDTWDYWVWFDNGDFLFFQFVVSSFGFGIERQGSVKAIYIRNGWETMEHGRNTEGVYRARRGFEWDDDDWSYAPEGFAMQFDDCQLTWDDEAGVYVVEMYDRTLSFALTIDPQADLYRPGNGTIEYGWDRHTYYDLTVLPRFDVEGRLTARLNRDDEENWVELSGVGYAEHSRINTFPFGIGQRLGNFRALRPDGLTIVYDEIIVADGYDDESEAFVLVDLDGETVFESAEVEVAVYESYGDENIGHSYTIPHTYEVVAQDGADYVRIIVTTHGTVMREDPLAVVSSIVRAVLSQQMIPMDYEIMADYEAWVHVDGETAYVSGHGWQTWNYTR